MFHTLVSFYLSNSSRWQMGQGVLFPLTDMSAEAQRCNDSGKGIFSLGLLFGQAFPEIQPQLLGSYYLFPDESWILSIPHFAIAFSMFKNVLHLESHSPFSSSLQLELWHSAIQHLALRRFHALEAHGWLLPLPLYRLFLWHQSHCLLWSWLYLSKVKWLRGLKDLS